MYLYVYVHVHINWCFVFQNSKPQCKKRVGTDWLTDWVHNCLLCKTNQLPLATWCHASIGTWFMVFIFCSSFLVSFLTSGSCYLIQWTSSSLMESLQVSQYRSKKWISNVPHWNSYLLTYNIISSSEWTSFIEYLLILFWIKCSYLKFIIEITVYIVKKKSQV